MQEEKLCILNSYLSALEGIKNEKDRARIWLLLIENAFNERQVDLSKERPLVKMGFKVLKPFIKTKKR